MFSVSNVTTVLSLLLLLLLKNAFQWLWKRYKERGKKGSARSTSLMRLTDNQKEIISVLKIASRHDDELEGDILELVYKRASMKRSRLNKGYGEDDEED